MSATQPHLGNTPTEMVNAPRPMPPNVANIAPTMSGPEDQDRNHGNTSPNPNMIRSAKLTKATSESSVPASP